MSLPRLFSSFWCLLNLCLTIVFATSDTNLVQRCVGGGVITPGWTVPKGDIVLEVGTPLEIFCTLDLNNTMAKNYTAQDIIFKKGNDKIDSKYVTVVNQTTARLSMENLPISPVSEYFYCFLVLQRGSKVTYYASISSLETTPSNDPPEVLICLNTVAIGSKPKEVNNFTCLSHNWEVLNCTWDEPNNGIKTNYSIFYSIPRRAGRNQLFGCPVREEKSCGWTMTTNPPYRRTFEYINFQIDGSNKFGNVSQTFKFHNYAHVIPNPPSRLVTVNKTAHSIYLQWNIGILEVFEKGIVFKVKYTWESSKYWNVHEYHHKDVEKERDKVRVNITDLKYPNIPYEFRVYMKSSVAGDDGWSEPASLIAKTSPVAPYRSPETDVGSFEIYSVHSHHRDILVYWKQLPDEEHNANNFQYEITVFEDNIEVNVKPISVTKTYAKFTNLSFNSYRFEIKSVNAIGSSPNPSIVYLPKKYLILPEPILFTKVDFGDGIYELSWKLPNATDDKVANFTIFWCESNREYPYPCTSFLNWTHLEAGTSKHNFTAKPQVGYQFAISVNSVNSSSGMLWALCTVLHNQVNKIRNVWMGKVGSNFMDLRWKLECSERVEGIKGYNITYCQVSDEHKHRCVDSEKTYLVYGDVTTIHGNITGLQPFTSYKASVAIFTDKLLGPPSEYLFNKTQDGAPDMKFIKVEVLNITDSTAIIKWNPPTNLNGILDHYEVYYNNEKKIVNETIAVLTGLKSYDMYHVRVVACTAVCSRTDPVALHTKIGAPGEVRKISAEKINSVHMKLKWELPAVPAGPNPVYDVKIQFDEPEQNSTFDEFETSETEATVKIPCKQEPTHSAYTFFVRAKNTDDSDVNNVKHYSGPWSSAYTIDCMNGGGLPTMWKVLLVLSVCTLFVSIFAFFGKKGIYKCQQMKKVEVVLPAKFTIPQLFPNEVKDVSYHVDIKSWTDSNEIDRLNKSSDTDHSSIDCIDLDVDTDREISRSSSGCYTS